ncbi:DMT family transporter [Rhizobium sp. S-51]|uniref:DMT family transporter n=1 Tax=Rhizobium terricola TaxID=2728849 RepID=A0A7Y0AT35_9HYPH|nr:DMT family transporter [Rhizobium terricola]NML72938.1 DMT family transporter [Rhizobium terricola]
MAAPKTGTGIGLAIVCLAILGIMPVLSNSRPADFSALGFAFWLSVWETVFAIPLVAHERRNGTSRLLSVEAGTASRRRALAVVVVTGAMFGLSTFLYVFGIERAGAVSAAIAMQAYPVFAILWESLFLKRRKSMVELLLTAVLMVALYYLGTGGTWRIDGFSPWFLLALGVPFLWSVAHVIIREELGRTPVTPAEVTLLRVAVSTVFLGGVVAIVDPQQFAAGLVRGDFLLFGMAMGLVYYLELIVWFYAIRHIDVSLASSITTPWPALTMVLSAIFLGDRVEPYQIAAFILIAGCIYGLMIAGLRKSSMGKLPA